MVVTRTRAGVKTECLEEEEGEADKQELDATSALDSNGNKDSSQPVASALPLNNQVHVTTEEEGEKVLDDVHEDHSEEDDGNVEASSNVSGEETVWGDYQTIFTHASWPENANCFVCNKKSGKLVSCERQIASADCPIVFHEKCVRAYNAGMFSYDYLLKKEGKRSCPLHHCSYCFQNRLKSTAVYFDAPEQNMVSCSKCIQSFHECCLPAGPLVESQMLIKGNPKSKSKSFVCPLHAQIERKDAKKFPDFGSDNLKTKKKFHLDLCTECEQKDGDLFYCTNCVRAYHSKCHRFQKVIDNGKEKSARNLCESCLIGEFVRHKAVAIAKFTDNMFYSCTTEDSSCFPLKYKNMDKYGRYLNKPGFVVVRWGGCENLFACLPITQVIPMFAGSYEEYGRTIRDKDYREAFQQMSKAPPFRKAIPPPCQHVEIETSEHAPGCTPRFTVLDEEELMCNCPGNSEDRCGINTNCHNRIMGYECPEDCEANSRICNNRSITKHQVAEGIVKKLCGLKGFGVFATKKIENGTVIAEYAGELISRAEKQKRIQATQKNANNDEHHYMMDLDIQRTIDCKNKGNIGRFINHSCEPNCTTAIVKIHMETIDKAKGKKYKMDERVAIIASRDIKPNEELCFNYRMEEQPGSQLPECLCGKRTCTGKMGKGGNRKSGDVIKPLRKRSSSGKDNNVNKQMKLLDIANQGNCGTIRPLEDIKEESDGALTNTNISSGNAEGEPESTKENENPAPLNTARPTRVAKTKSYVSQLVKSKPEFKDKRGKRAESNQPSQVDTMAELDDNGSQSD